MSHQARRDSADMVAGDLMTDRVISVRTGASVQSVAQTLFENLIGAVLVIDDADVPVGMVSDGDLLGRRAKEERQDWWLGLLGRDTPPPTLSTAARVRAVQDVMSAPLISVSPYTPVREVVRLLQTHRIKRLAVILDDKLVGIVSRSDVLNLVAQLPKTAAEEAGTTGGLYGLLQSLVGGANHTTPSDTLAAAERAGQAAPETATLSADSLRNLVTASEQEKIDEAAASKRVRSLERQREVKSVLEQRVTNEFWQQLLSHAELAAKHGEKELLLLRFPADVCSDGGRAVNNIEEGWNKTLRGEAAELYARWDSELRPKGFGLSIRTISFETGGIGDLGLILTWTQ